MNEVDLAIALMIGLSIGLTAGIVVYFGIGLLEVKKGDKYE